MALKACNGTGGGRCGHFHAAVYVLYGGSRLEYTGSYENELAAHGRGQHLRRHVDVKELAVLQDEPPRA